jgi:hypothetical protein
MRMRREAAIEQALAESGKKVSHNQGGDSGKGLFSKLFNLF